MSDFRENMERINNSPQMRVFNAAISLAAAGLTARKFYREPTVWNALPVVRCVLIFAETFKPKKDR